MLVARRLEGEKWRDAVKRIAAQFGLEEECLEEYDEAAKNDDDADAAWGALYEWDVLSYEPELEDD
jgi:hypothetical protein